MITLILRQHSVCSIFWWMEVTKNIRRHDYNRWGWILFVKQKRCSIEEGKASGNNVDQKFTGFLLVSKKQHYFHISWNISLGIRKPKWNVKGIILASIKVGRTINANWSCFDSFIMNVFLFSLTHLMSKLIFFSWEPPLL